MDEVAMSQPMTDTDLAARLTRLEDIESMGRLKAAYCAACDDDHDGEAVVRLYGASGTWATSLGAECRDFDAIRTYFGEIRASGRMRYSTHMVTNQVVDVTGDQAVATWSFAMMFTDREDRRFRILGFYRDEFVRTEDGWRFERISSQVQDYAQLAIVRDTSGG